MCVCACVCVCVRACVRVRACARAGGGCGTASILEMHHLKTQQTRRGDGGASCNLYQIGILARDEDVGPGRVERQVPSVAAVDKRLAPVGLERA